MTPLVSLIGLPVLTLFIAGCAPMARIDSRLSQLDLSADTYIVRAGETLDSIAYRYQISKSDLVALNPGISPRPQMGTAVQIRQGRAPIESEGIASAAVSELTRTVPTSDQAYTTPTTIATATKAPAVTTYQGSTRGVEVAVMDDPLSFVPPPVNTTSGPIEIVEERYVHKDGPITQQEVGQQLQSYVGRWVWPTTGHVARGFAPKTEGRHGVDISGVPGQPVVAAHNGTVWFTGRDPSGTGNIVIVKHADDLLTAYSHIEEMLVRENQPVRAGDQIATLGSNSRQESVLRFEVRRNGNPLNPMDFLQER